jgi:hypothetical protein
MRARRASNLLTVIPENLIALRVPVPDARNRAEEHNRT